MPSEEDRDAAKANAGSSKPLPKVKVEEGGKDDLGKKSPGKLATSRVKKEETDDDDDKPIARRTAVVKTDKKMSVKKEVKEEDDKKVVKVEVKRRNTNATAATTAADAQIGKKRKKVYDLPGQKRDPPEEREPLRIFYETLYKQIPHSEMAQFWMMESGLLSREDAKKVFEKKQKSKFASPAKSTGSARRTPQSAPARKTVSSTASSIKKTTEVKVSSRQSKKRKGGDGSSDDSDNDFVLASRVTKRQRAS